MPDTIWKYDLHPADAFGNPTDTHTFDIPHGGQILSIQMQGDRPMMWVRVDPSKPKYPRHFVHIGTGNTIDPAHLIYRGTWQSGGFVFHVFEEIR